MTPEQLKASILQRAMEGKLVPQDPNDEPASELLKRIKAEKEKLIKEGKIKRDKNGTEIFRGDDGLHYEKFADGTIKEIEVPYDIPESWEWTRIRNIYWSSGQITPTKKFRYVDTGAVDNIHNEISYNNISWIEADKAPSRARKLVEYDSVVFSTVRPYLKNIAVIKDSSPDSMIASTAFIILNSLLDSEFLKTLLCSPMFVEQVNSKATGTSYPAINDTNFNTLLVPVVPIEEQSRIQVEIHEAFEKVRIYSDNYFKLEKLNKEFSEKLRKSILQYAMQGKLVPQDPNDEPVEVLLEKIRQEKQKLFEEGKLKKKDLEESIIYKGDDNSYYEKNGNSSHKIDVPFDIPEHWKWVKLDYISQYIQRGKSPKYVEKSEIPIISQKCIQWSGFDLSPARFLDPKYFSSYDNRRLICRNDLLWCSTGKGTVGRVGIFTDADKGIYSNIVADSHVTVIRQFDVMNPKFTLEYLSSPKIQLNMDELTTGSTKQQELSLSTVTNILLPICGRSEQDKIIAEISQFERYISRIQITV